jgi:hypothetical protein
MEATLQYFGDSVLRPYALPALPGTSSRTF